MVLYAKESKVWDTTEVTELSTEQKGTIFYLSLYKSVHKGFPPKKKVKNYMI